MDRVSFLVKEEMRATTARDMSLAIPSINYTARNCGAVIGAQSKACHKTPSRCRPADRRSAGQRRCSRRCRSTPSLGTQTAVEVARSSSNDALRLQPGHFDTFCRRRSQERSTSLPPGKLFSLDDLGLEQSVRGIGAP
jgi:hypothetical protein